MHRHQQHCKDAAMPNEHSTMHRLPAALQRDTALPKHLATPPSLHSTHQGVSNCSAAQVHWPVGASSSRVSSGQSICTCRSHSSQAASGRGGHTCSAANAAACAQASSGRSGQVSSGSSSHASGRSYHTCRRSHNGQAASGRSGHSCSAANACAEAHSGQISSGHSSHISSGRSGQVSSGTANSHSGHSCAAATNAGACAKAEARRSQITSGSSSQIANETASGRSGHIASSQTGTSRSGQISSGSSSQVATHHTCRSHCGQTARGHISSGSSNRISNGHSGRISSRSRRQISSSSSSWVASGSMRGTLGVVCTLASSWAGHHTHGLCLSPIRIPTLASSTGCSRPMPTLASCMGRSTSIHMAGHGCSNAAQITGWCLCSQLCRRGGSSSAMGYGHMHPGHASSAWWWHLHAWRLWYRAKSILIIIGQWVTWARWHVRGRMHHSGQCWIGCTAAADIHHCHHPRDCMLPVSCLMPRMLIITEVPGSGV